MATGVPSGVTPRNGNFWTLESVPQDVFIRAHDALARAPRQGKLRLLRHPPGLLARVPWRVEREAPESVAPSPSQRLACEKLPELTSPLAEGLGKLISLCKASGGDLVEHAEKVSLPAIGQPLSIEQAERVSTLLFVTCGSGWSDEIQGARTNVVEACVGEAAILRRYDAIDWDASQKAGGLIER